MLINTSRAQFTVQYDLIYRINLLNRIDVFMGNNSQFSHLNLAFAEFLSQRTAFVEPQLNQFKTLIAELSFKQSQGHICLQVNKEAAELVNQSHLATQSAKLSPLVLEEQRLYLQRYWFYEDRLARQLNGFIGRCYPAPKSDIVDRYFRDLIDEIDWQREAAKKAITQAFCMITGGPGTGKTTTVVKILALLQELANVTQGDFLHIALATPTGKAAMRLQESIGSNKARLPCSEAIKQHIPETVTTLHRLLGSLPNSAYFKHDAANPLNYDVVVIDEVSMVDLALMSKLVDALKPNSRLILLGDKNQLASVESGSVLADLTATLHNNTIELQKSYRFNGVIKALAEAVNAQQVDTAWDLLTQSQTEMGLLEEELIDYIVKQYSRYLDKVQQSTDFKDIFQTFGQFQVLCTNRTTTRGVVAINKAVEKQLSLQRKINVSGQWYQGRPVMVTQNDPSMQLYNGDIGLYLYDIQLQENRILFLRPDGSIKKVLPSRMPVHETVFAMTIHKSQGSEFDECLCVLPLEMNPVLNKQLIYTAITRAKQRVTLASDETIFKQTLKQQVSRDGGLASKLSRHILKTLDNTQ